jgi:hypothetical protein
MAFKPWHCEGMVPPVGDEEGGSETRLRLIDRDEMIVLEVRVTDG